MTPSDPPSAPAEALLLTAPKKRWYARITTWIVILLIVAVGVWFWHRRSTEASTSGAAAAPGAEGKRAGAKGKGSDGGGSRRGAALGPNDVMPVGVATAKLADVPVYLTGLGSVTPLATVTVKARVDGLLEKINYREGQIVKPGDVLAEIDPRPFQVVVEQSAGTLARDQALLANAKVDQDRYRKLVEQDSIATQQLDTQRSLVSQLEGTVKGDVGNLDSAKLQLSFTKIRAPVGGRIGLRQVDVGNMVHASDTNGIVVITQLQPIDVVFAVPEINVQRIMKRLVAGTTLPVDAWNRDNKTKLADGTLLTVDNEIDVATGTVKLKGRFSNNGYDLFPNQFVNARLLLDVQRGATVIPPAAVQRGAQGFYAYVVNANNTVTARTVTPGIASGDQQAITDGIKAGEVVVVDGTDKLREGAKVEPVARDGAAIPAPAAGARTGGRADKAGATPGAPADAAASGQPAAASGTTSASDATAGRGGYGGTPEERQKRWEAIDKRIDAGEFGEEIKKLPEDQRKEKMRELRQQKQGGDASGGPGGGAAPGGGPPP